MLGKFFKQNTVFCVAAILALVSCLLIPPSLSYIDYIDFRVLTLLFCLMSVVSGLQTTGLFDAISNTLLRRAHSIKQLALILICIAFFASMFITNDVALLAFVPLSILVFEQANKDSYSFQPYYTKSLIVLIVLQTIAANVGSMLTPIGNPQNLYLYSLSGFSLPTFFYYTIPLTVLSLLLLILACRICFPNIRMKAPNTVAPPLKKQPLFVYSVLFLFCLFTVAHILDWQILFIIVLLTLIIYCPSILKSVDYGLLATFVCFFIFIGNLGQIEVIKQWLETIITGQELIVSALVSQIISNVPAAILLSNFTSSYGHLLLGVNIGGLGTLVASLASLISWKQYTNSSNANPKRYLIVFTVYNIVFFFCLLLFVIWFYHI